MKEKNLYSKLKRKEPEIKNLNHIKNNIILISNLDKKKSLSELLILITLFLISTLLLTFNNISFNNNFNDIYLESSFSLIFPTFLISGVLALAGLLFYIIIKHILEPKEV